MAHETTLYSVLRVPENATSDEIKQAYRRLAKLWHPDLNPDDKSAEKRMQEITEAYAILSDPAKKWKYDDDLSRKRSKLRARQEQEERDRKAAAAAAAATAARAHVNKARQTDPDYTSDSYYEDFTRSPFVVNGNYGSSVHGKTSDQRQSSRSDHHDGVDNLTAGQKRLEDFSVAMCVLFPLLIPIVHKHMKESLELYPRSRHYRDALTSLRIVTIFAVPLWTLIITLIVRAVFGLRM